MRVFVVSLALACTAAAVDVDTASGIMARVAANQDRAERLRSQFVYQQTVLTRLRRGNHALAREERSEYTVLPGPEGIQKKLTAFSGRYERKGKLAGYDHPHFEYKDMDIDGELISDLTDDLTGEGSRNGIATCLFPLTVEEQRKYTFRLAAKELYRGREVYRIAFRPKPHAEDAAWKGEVLVDAREYEPVLVSTRLARAVPFWVRTFLGTNLKYLGFSVGYERFDDGVWFPVSYGGEFEVRAVFFYKRLISISLANTGFRRADVTSRITYLPDAK